MKEVRAVASNKELSRFIDFPHELYKNDPLYVPELFTAQHDLLNTKKHPFYKHSRLQLFLAYDQGVVVGRIAAILNVNHNNYNQSKDGFFGFFDCVNDQQIANSLLDVAIAWIKQQDASLNKLIGPVSFSTNETCGALLEGFDQSPMAMMPYNAPYYLDLFGNAGLQKQVDLYAYYIATKDADNRSVRLLDVLEMRLLRSNIKIRTINVKDFKNEIGRIKSVYNKAWDKNLGFVPMTDEEFDFMAKDMKTILDPDFCLIAEKDGEPIGFALGIPNINQILKNINKGRLLPFGIFKLLFGLKSINELRVLTLGVNEGYRKLGIEACLYGYIIKNAQIKGIKGAECSWMLEDNYLMNKAIEQIGGVLTKKYRIFEKSI